MVSHFSVCRLLFPGLPYIPRIKIVSLRALTLHFVFEGSLVFKEPIAIDQYYMGACIGLVNLLSVCLPSTFISPLSSNAS